MAPSARLETARVEALHADMRENDIVAEGFTIRSYERARVPHTGGMVRIYIEGDGLAWLSKSRPSSDPTPLRPVALSLAQADVFENVVYLARPCQYNVTYNGHRCPDKYWRSARFAPETVAAMNLAIDDVRARYGFGSVELVGFSGGAAMAVLAAADRHDVVSIRTVAGNLDTESFARLHDVTPLSSSLNPAGVAAAMAHLPQRHFISGQDDVVPPEIFARYAATAGGGACIASDILPGVTHEEGWTALWPRLLALPVTCTGH